MIRMLEMQLQTSALTLLSEDDPNVCVQVPEEAALHVKRIDSPVIAFF